MAKLETRSDTERTEMGITIVREGQWDLGAIDSPGNSLGAEGVPEAEARKVARQVVSDSGPHVHISRVRAGHSGLLHSHTAPEAMIVLKGAARISGVEDVCGPGSIVVVPADEPYSLSSEPGEDLVIVIVRSVPGKYQLEE